MMLPFMRSTPEAFWRWFAGRAEEWRGVDLSARPGVVRAIGKRLGRCARGIAFGIEPGTR